MMNARALRAAACAVATSAAFAAPAAAAIETMTRTAVEPVPFAEIAGDFAAMHGEFDLLTRVSATPQIGADPFTRDWLRLQSKPEVAGKALECLTEAIYFEARGEPVRGQFAVAEVILNRVASHEFPDTVCAVVNQGTGRKHACQFSYTCDGLPEAYNDEAARVRSEKIAAIALDEEDTLDLTEGAMFYHTKAVNPYWADLFDRTTTIGAHHFYNSDEWDRS